MARGPSQQPGTLRHGNGSGSGSRNGGDQIRGYLGGVHKTWVVCSWGRSRDWFSWYHSYGGPRRTVKRGSWSELRQGRQGRITLRRTRSWSRFDSLPVGR